MEAKLLDKRPTSGDYLERWFDATGDCVSALFTDMDYREWVGVFGVGGVTDFTTCLMFPASSGALVIARGKGYVVDVNSGDLRYRTKCSYLVHALQSAGRDAIVACDFTNLYLLSSSAERWNRDGIADDGIILDRSECGSLSGRVWRHDGWRPFNLNLDTSTITFGELLPE